MTIPRRTFEALLRPEVVALEGPLVAELAALGIDVGALAPWSSVAALRDAIDAVRRAACGERGVDEGFREVGRRFVQGFKRTTVGWIFSTMAPAFGPDLTMQSMPRYLTSVRAAFPVTVVAEGDQRYRFLCPDPDINAFFMAGSVEVTLETCGVHDGRVQVVLKDVGFELEVRWPG